MGGNPNLDCSSRVTSTNQKHTPNFFPLHTYPHTSHACSSSTHTYTLLHRLDCLTRHTLSNCTGETRVCVSVKVKYYTCICADTPCLTHEAAEIFYHSIWPQWGRVSKAPVQLTQEKWRMMILLTRTKRSAFCKLAWSI